jgi:hypothetical protein
MDTTLTPETYTPGIDYQGNYIDDISGIRNIRHGIHCLCGSRKEKTYPNAASFTAHTKTKHHQQWLETLNQNKANYYVESLRYKELVESQQKILTSLENQLVVKSALVVSLEKQVTSLRIQLVSFVSNIQLD